ncbi:hypothetical protein [Natrononativus amylolyticus]|uniref:hypothetical protein n=1 Tax=Natrononativus amylolyticus TaxID=2963434 RepID=UPI0020CC654B|nr:hypothetical protein [Natrononativus amylolyticus]
MAPRSPTVTEQRRRQLAHRQLEQTVERLEVTERRLTQVHNTLKAVAQDAGIAVGGPCGRCDRSFLLIAEGTMRCPACGYRRSL